MEAGMKGFWCALWPAPPRAETVELNTLCTAACIYPLTPVKQATRNAGLQVPVSKHLCDGEGAGHPQPVHAVHDVWLLDARWPLRLRASVLRAVAVARAHRTVHLHFATLPVRSRARTPTCHTCAMHNEVCAHAMHLLRALHAQAGTVLLCVSCGTSTETRRGFRRLPLTERLTMLPWLFATIDFDSTPESYERYDKMSALDMFRSYGVSKRMYEEFIKPTLLVGLFAPPEELSAGATMGMLYYYGAQLET